MTAMGVLGKGNRMRQRMRQRIMMTCAAALLAIALTACDDGDDAGAAEVTGEEPAASEEPEGADEAPPEDAGEGADTGAQPDDLPDEWPDELPVHGGVELGRVIVEDHDGSPYIQMQYRTDEDVEEAAAWLESLEEHGWDADVEEGSEGTNRFVDANLDGHGWSVRVSFENNLYTWTVQEE
jgi:hypothetical protein